MRLNSSLDLLRLVALNSARYPFLLESAVHGTAQSRYDILFAFPGKTIIADQASDFLETLDAEWQPGKASDPPSALPFNGGWFLYLGYELVTQIEHKLKFEPYDSSLPTAFATRIPAAVIRDHQQSCLYLVTESGQEQLLAELRKDISSITAHESLTASLPKITAVQSGAGTNFTDGVERIKRYIRDGDVFQVNLSRSWDVDLATGTSPINLYASLRQHNPAPFAALVLQGDNAIISSSPERLVQVTGDRIDTRPIAGTRPRGKNKEDDLAYSRTLLAHPKERAEHVMLIDLERNDLGRICQPGSIHVDELMVLESYAHVHHIVSNVTGRLRPKVTPGQVIRAVFPGGTITGCPKVRCMEIIHDLEASPRGPYTGSVGYFGHDGNMDLNILIRTMHMEHDRIRFRTGAGIVADSVADSELQETQAKAKGLLRALGINDAISG
ncbi:MAG: aminodeoxychorismate synthase component I [Gammaproteobacteria bacterium]|nr:aminodeoxychorismate synthase component I [Gammaproteobacteria bacterium]